MNESRREELIDSFRDREYRESYAQDFLNTTIATQLRVIREQRDLTQAELAEAVGTKQTAISRIENVDNTARNIGTLMEIAFRLDCRLKVSFETFGSLIEESLQFSRENLHRPTFSEDPVFTGGIPGPIYTIPMVGTGLINGQYISGGNLQIGLVGANSRFGIMGIRYPAHDTSYTHIPDTGVCVTACNYTGVCTLFASGVGVSDAIGGVAIKSPQKPPKKNESGFALAA